MNIKKYRQMRGETQLDVANAIGVSRVSYLRYEAGITEPSFDTLTALAVYFGITIDELLGVNPEKQRKKISFSDRIKELRLQHGYSQKKLADMLYVDQTTISYWEKGKSFPDYNKQQTLADIFNVTIDYLTGRTDNPAKQRAKKIPVLGYVKAGIHIEAIEDILDYEEISEDMARTGEYVGLRICGDSMEPRFKEGDVVIVRIQSDCDSGDIAVVMINGDEATVKKIDKNRAGIKLIPFNSSYDPMFFTNQEIEELPVRLFGRVVELRAKF